MFPWRVEVSPCLCQATDIPREFSLTDQRFRAIVSAAAEPAPEIPMPRPARVIPIVLIAAASAHAQDVLDTFSNGVNLGGWGFHGPDEVIAPTGGNPGAYFRSSGLDTTIPRLRCLETSPFTGNFRQMGVTG